jgi:hypothetical protein
LSVDWVLYDRNNPLLYKVDFKKYNVYYEYWKIDEHGNKIVKYFDYEHSYAVYTLIQNSLKYAQSMGKKYIHLINYDYEIPNYIFYNHLNYLHLGYNIVFYKYHHNSYSTGFLSGEITTLLNYFDKYKTMEEFYLSDNNYAILEERIYNYYNNSSFFIKELLYADLETVAKTNQEGVLQFSKVWNITE